MKIFFISSSAYVLYLIKSKYRSVSTTCGGAAPCQDGALTACYPCTRPSQDPAIDTFRLEYIIGPCAVLGLIFNYKLSVSSSPRQILCLTRADKTHALPLIGKTAQ